MLWQFSLMLALAVICEIRTTIRQIPCAPQRISSGSVVLISISSCRRQGSGTEERCVYRFTVNGKHEYIPCVSAEDRARLSERPERRADVDGKRGLPIVEGRPPFGLPLTSTR